MKRVLKASAKAGRRRFLLAATGAATVAMPQVSSAQTVRWRVQSAWASRELFHELALDYAKRVDVMSGGRLKLDVLAAGSVVLPLQIADAVHSGILDGGHGTAGLRYNKHKASGLFGTPPSFGWDSQGFLAWFYYGGGEVLYAELLSRILRLNLTGFLYFPMPAQPLGWFKKPVRTADDLRGLRFRISGLSAEVLRQMGATITLLPNTDVVAAMERGVLDAVDSNNPTTDVQLGIPDVAKHYLMASHLRPVEAFEIIFNRAKFDALSPELRIILRQAALAASSDQVWSTYTRYAKDLDEIARRGVTIARVSAELLAAELNAWDRVIAEYVQEPIFAKVIASQKDWVKRTGAFQHASDLDSNALSAAYRHFFG
jgi:TRAP-type mannitol/chloroaromatic compound transport system substrate-binding protein